MPLTDEPNLPPAGGESPFRKIFPYTTVLMVIVVLWVAWILYSRHAENARATADLQAKQEQAQRDNANFVLQHGELTFTTFEAADGTLKPGQSTELCYGVVNAKNVKIDPPVEQIKPSIRHCMDIAPKKTTIYTITADDGAGHTKSVSLTVHVK
ncbi:MAG: hypothetical protein M3Y57_00090 [Acidobacteriota bacterium]|nr:hypothetical protein [Acidobacteriota bacterium]